MDSVDFNNIRPMYPVFVTNKDLHVMTYVWVPGSSPHQEPLTISIPEGTEISMGWSRLEGGYAMSINTPRKVPDLRGTKNQQWRWFPCMFGDMSYLEHRVSR